MNWTRLFAHLVIAEALAPLLVLADEKLYRVSSRDVGWNNIDLTITEQRRDARTSYLNVPRYGKRSSVESRFAMCAFTDLTFRRGFQVWVVGHPAPDDDHVTLGFLKSEAEDARTALGEQFTTENSLKANARVLNRMCGIKEPGK
jgi:hypothetical protein